MSAIPTERKAKLLRKLFEVADTYRTGQPRRGGLKPPKALAKRLSLIANDDVGLLVSTGGFTRDAEQEEEYLRLRPGIEL